MDFLNPWSTYIILSYTIINTIQLGRKTGYYHFDNRTSPMSCPENRREMGYERGMKLSTIVVVHPIERMPWTILEIHHWRVNDFHESTIDIFYIYIEYRYYTIIIIPWFVRHFLPPEAPRPKRPKRPKRPVPTSPQRRSPVSHGLNHGFNQLFFFF